MLMATAEISYILPEFDKHEADFEEIVTAIGKYETEIGEKHEPTAYFSEDKNTVVLRLERSVAGQPNYAAAQEVAERMRLGVEKHLSDESRERLSKRFAGIAITGDLQRE
jgi:hypothetical protein